MNILYLDCRYKLTEKNLLAGLLQLGATPQVLEPALEAFPQYASEISQAIQNGQLDTFLMSDGEMSFPTPIRHIFEDLTRNALSVKVCEEIRQILPLIDNNKNLAEAIAAGQGVVLLAAILNAIEILKIDAIYSSALPLALPEVPDDLLAVLQCGQIPLGSPIQNAQVSPLMAAFLATRAQFMQPEMRLTHTATLSLANGNLQPTALRLMLGEPLKTPHEHGMSHDGKKHEHKMSLLQANMDDITPQQVAYVLERLTVMGARDVYQVPLVMKKNRMGMQLNAVVRAADETLISEFIMRETPTLGIRVFYIDKHPMTSYEIRNVHTDYGDIPVKYKSLNGEIIGAQPEYDICVERALEYQRPLQQVMLAAQTAALEYLKNEL